MSEDAFKAGREVIAEAVEALKRGETVHLYLLGREKSLPIREVNMGGYSFWAQSAGSVTYSVAYSAVAFIQVGAAMGGSVAGINLP